MILPTEKELREFERWGVSPPSHQDHGLTEEQIREKLVPMEATRWWMEGNMLCADTNHGILKQRIPTDYICLGTDNRGLPILKKIDI